MSAEKPRWIPLSERKPEIGQWVWLNGEEIEAATWHDSYDGYATHWMPLDVPEPPAESEEDKAQERGEV